MSLRQPFCSGLFPCPDLHASQQLGRLQQAFHEVDLVDAGREEVAAEFRKACQSEIATAVEVAVSRIVRGLQHGLVVSDATRQATRNRPEFGSHVQFAQQCVREQPRHATVAVQEGVDPSQAMVGCGDADERSLERLDDV
jgi:hypothetical protein